MIAYGLLPDCQIVYDEDYGENLCQLPIGRLRFSGYDNGTGFRFRLDLQFNDANSCIAFSSIDWVSAIPVEWWNPYGFLDIGSNTVYAPYGGLTSINMTDIIEGCHSDNPDFYLAIHSDV